MSDAPSIAIAFVTIERPEVAQRFVISARRHFPNCPIYVADQSRQLEPMIDFYRENNITVVRMEFDAGLSASRNALARHIREDYFLLCDDDFILVPDSDFHDAIAILQGYPDIGVVGGRLHDYDGREERIRSWELFFNHDLAREILTAVPIYNYAPCRRFVDQRVAYLSDSVLNFAVYRRTIFSEVVTWDEAIKINGEHEDFFLNLKFNSPWKVVHLPTLRALHVHVPNHERYEQTLRSRQEGWALMLRKWNLQQHLEIVPLGYLAEDAPPYEQQFFSSRTPVIGQTLVHDQFPGQDDHHKAGIEFMRLRRIARVEEPPGPSQPISLIEFLPAPPPLSTLAELSLVELSFRYKPVHADQGDFIVWCRAHRTKPGPARRIDLRARWFSPSGAVIVWSTPRLTHYDVDADWWVPLQVNVPLWPTESEYLRFELWADSDDYFHPIAMGFLFRACGGEIDVRDVSALRVGVGSPLADFATADSATVIAWANPNQSGVILDVSSATHSVLLGRTAEMYLYFSKEINMSAPEFIAIPTDFPRVNLQTTHY